MVGIDVVVASKISEFIDDPLTWFNFSLFSRTAAVACRAGSSVAKMRFRKKVILHGINKEYWVLPNGHKHGEYLVGKGVIEKAYYNDNVLHGHRMYTYMGASCTKKWEENYNYGKLHGERRGYEGNRATLIENYSNGEKHGVFQYFLPNSEGDNVLVYEGNYHLGFKHGVQRKWMPDRVLIERSVYRYGKPMGDKSKWNPRGIPIKVVGASRTKPSKSRIQKKQRGWRRGPKKISLRKSRQARKKDVYKLVGANAMNR